MDKRKRGWEGRMMEKKGNKERLMEEVEKKKRRKIKDK